MGLNIECRVAKSRSSAKSLTTVKRTLTKYTQTHTLMATHGVVIYTPAKICTPHSAVWQNYNGLIQPIAILAQGVRSSPVGGRAATLWLVTFKGPRCVDQVGPVQAWGSVWEGHEAWVAELGPVRQGAVRVPELICRDRQALRSVTGLS